MTRIEPTIDESPARTEPSAVAREIDSASSIRRVETQFRGFDSCLLQRRAWLPAEPRLLVVVAHGFAEHIGRYEAFGTWFSMRGAAVHGYDHRGHGQSGGPKAHVDAFNEYAEDLREFVALARSEHPGLPCFLVAHSMGSLVAATAIGQGDWGSDLAGIVLSGAPLFAFQRMPRIKKLAAEWLRPLWPRLKVGAGINAEGLSRDPEVGRLYQADPLVFEKGSLSLAVEFKKACDWAAESAGPSPVPVLVLHGGDDPLCPSDGGRLLFERLSSERVPGSELHIYPELRHEILNEPEQQEIFARIWDWCGDRDSDPDPDPDRDRARP